MVRGEFESDWHIGHFLLKSIYNFVVFEQPANLPCQNESLSHTLDKADLGGFTNACISSQVFDKEMELYSK